MPSAVIRRYAYRPELSALDVEFVSGRVYRYLAVPAALADEMHAWRAKGAFLNRKVLGRFAYEQLGAWPEPAEPGGL